MNDKKIMKILAAMFLLRAEYWCGRNEIDAAAAYENAFNMLVYALRGNWDYLRQFGWSDEAEELIDKVGADVDLWKLEEIIRGWNR